MNGAANKVFSLALILGAFAAGGRWALALDLSDHLTLSPATRPSEAQEELPDIAAPDEDVAALDLQVTPPAAAPSCTDMSGVELADFNNQVYAVALRNTRGLGLGLANTGGVALTGGFATKDGMQVSLYYVRRFTDITDAIRDVGIDLTGAPDKTVGITVGWKF